MANNVMEQKKDVASKLNSIAGDFMQFIEYEFADCSSYFAEKIEENVKNLLDVDKPKVMVYGIYNSGKSTLINSLCKEEVAQMADRPMTDQIAEYDRGDYYLVDSPGVDAPIQHEEVTEDHINKCHIILFVISSKGLFEDRTNYRKLANLITKEIPFIIVLNDRGCPVGKDWDEERKKKAKFEHDQELKIIQYKIIKNLKNESNNPQIAEKYEVVTLNAKKAWTGVTKNKPQLYDVSGVEFLEKRISQLISNNASLSAVFKQPISNLKECLNETEKMITQTMSGNQSEDFGMRLHVLESKRDNIMQDMRILTQHAVQSHLDELTNSYINGDADIYETIANTIYMDIQERYSAKINELFVYVDRNFKELNLFLDSMSNLEYNSFGKTGSRLSEKEPEEYREQEFELPKEEKGFWFFEIFKSREKKEQERMEYLQREAEWRNQQAEYRREEEIRRRQEARQLASSDLDVLCREFNTVVNQGMDEKYDELISQIQQIDCLNKQAREEGKRQMEKIKELRKAISVIENSLKA